MAEEVKRAVCEFCHSKCKVLVHVADGNLVKFEYDPMDPRGPAMPPPEACLRLRGAQEWMYHPDRLNFPLKRAGQRGEGKWQQISWEQCLDEIAERLQRVKEEYGPEAIAMTTGTLRNRSEMCSPMTIPTPVMNSAAAGRLKRRYARSTSARCIKH